MSHSEGCPTCDGAGWVARVRPGIWHPNECPECARVKRLIKVERERCAKIVDNIAARYIALGSDTTAQSRAEGEVVRRGKFVATIAAAIRRQG